MGCVGQVGNAATYNNDKGVMLVTSAGRRNGPSCVDSKIHHCNLINNSKIHMLYYQITCIVYIDTVCCVWGI